MFIGWIIDLFLIPSMDRAADTKYKEGKINFYDYFVKRLQVYNQTQPSKHIQFYKGVDMIKYQKKLRDILEPILLLR